MPKITNLSAVALVIIAPAFIAGGASAQNNRSFVSGQGNDSNPCSISAPCRTFAHALTATTSGGETLEGGGVGQDGINLTSSPPFNVKTLSEARIVSGRWAMTTRVIPVRLRALLTARSLTKSRWLVASSSSRILGSR
jgi:hypothetical protein